MSGRVGRPYYGRLNAPRKRFVVFRYDGEEVTVKDLLLVAIGVAATYLVVCGLLLAGA